MLTVWLIGILLCILIQYVLKDANLCIRERESVYSCWKNYTWTVLESPIKFPRIIRILCAIGTFIPVINIVLFIVILIALCIYLCEHEGTDGTDYKEYKIELHSKLVNWLLEKT